MALTRSEQMARIKGRDTSPERALRRELFARGRRYRIHRRVDGCRPDLVFGPARTAVFIDGCFWHGCPTHYIAPKSRNAFWTAKLEQNRERDVRQTKQLERSGWLVLRFWEHDVELDVARVADQIEGALRRRFAAGFRR